MKKLLSIMLVMVFAVLAFTACGGSSDSSDLSDSKYVGTWKNVSVGVGDETGELDSEFTLVLNGDGTGQLISDGEGGDFTWELTSDGFKTKGDMKMTFKDDGDNIKAKIFGVELVFEKQ